MKKEKIIGIILSVLIMVGIIVTCIWGLNFGLLYAPHQDIDILIGQEFENKDIYKIVKEVVGNKSVAVKKVELYEEMVSISIKEVTDEQLQNINTKINEKYGTENKVEDIIVTSTPNVRGRDLIKPYILPISISVIIILVYMIVYIAIYNHMGKNIKIAKTIGIAIGTIIITQLLYLAILAITRLPINTITLPIGMIVYIVSTIGILVYIEKI